MIGEPGLEPQGHVAAGLVWGGGVGRRVSHSSCSVLWEGIVAATAAAAWRPQRHSRRMRAVLRPPRPAHQCSCSPKRAFRALTLPLSR